MAESAFRQSMILSGGSIAIFWSNGLVAGICALAIFVLFWPQISAGLSRFMTARAARQNSPGE